MKEQSVKTLENVQVFDLIDDREWEALKTLIRSKPSVAEEALSKASGDSGRRSSEGQLALHEACKCKPPLDVVELLIDANISALKAKGQRGFTPLHWAVSQGASVDVVAKLINSYPPGTRMRDDILQVLPIHLAAKWGASEEVLMEILIAHPEGFYIRDGDCLTPLDYANRLSSESDREEMKRVLSHAPLLCKVSKAAQVRVAHEHDTKLRSIQEGHSTQVAEWDARYVQDKLKFKRVEQSLKLDLDSVTDLAETSSRQLNEKITELTDLTVKHAELEALLEKERKKFNNTLDVRRAEMQTIIDAEMEKSKLLLQHVNEKEDQIRDFEEKLENLEAVKATLEIDLDSGREVIHMMVEEVEKLPILEALLENKTERIKELDAEAELESLAKEILSQKLEGTEKARMEAADGLMQTSVECDILREYNADLLNKLRESNRLAETYKARIEYVRDWFKEMTTGMDKWSVEQAFRQLDPNGVPKTDLNGDNATVTTEDDTCASSNQTIEERAQIPYGGDEVSLERITGRALGQHREKISPRGQYRERASSIGQERVSSRGQSRDISTIGLYRRRISPVGDDIKRYHQHHKESLSVTGVVESDQLKDAENVGDDIISDKQKGTLSAGEASEHDQNYEDESVGDDVETDQQKGSGSAEGDDELAGANERHHHSGRISVETVEDGKETPYDGVEVSLDGISGGSLGQYRECVSPSSEYRDVSPIDRYSRRISPIGEDIKRYHQHHKESVSVSCLVEYDQLKDTENVGDDVYFDQQQETVYAGEASEHDQNNADESVGDGVETDQQKGSGSAGGDDELAGANEHCHHSGRISVEYDQLKDTDIVGDDVDFDHQKETVSLGEASEHDQNYADESVGDDVETGEQNGSGSAGGDDELEEANEHCHHSGRISVEYDQFKDTDIAGDDVDFDQQKETVSLGEAREDDQNNEGESVGDDFETDEQNGSGSAEGDDELTNEQYHRSGSISVETVDVDED
jgi:hypothetical protein